MISSRILANDTSIKSQSNPNVLDVPAPSSATHEPLHTIRISDTLTTKSAAAVARSSSSVSAAATVVSLIVASSVWAGLYMLEVSNRNTAGSNDWLAAITRSITGIDMDIVEEELSQDTVLQMEG